MCGISGVVDKRVVDKEKVIKKMTKLIEHRGPDDDGFFVDEHVGLGMRRLSIIDLESGRQPISSQDERYLIFFNGEIYNYQELKKELPDYNFKTASDTEVILAGFLEWGEGVVSKLRGMFAFAIYDQEENTLFLARDQFGIKPLYYLRRAGEVAAFSSEIKSFLAIPGWKPEVNDTAVYNYLSFQYNPLEETFFKDVYKLEPGHFMKIDLVRGRDAVARYWHFEFDQDETLEKESTEKKVLDIMRDSVAHHMIADVPVASFLSGGIDSSIIATLLHELREGEEDAPKLKTFTVGFESLTEGEEARETSDALGTDHKEITVGKEEYFKVLQHAVWHFDEPVADPSAIGLFFLAREASQHVKVVLSGEGSDELFGGYNIYLEPFAREKISWIPQGVLETLLKLPFEFKGKNYLRRASRRTRDWYIGNASIFTPEERDKLWKGREEKALSLDPLYEEVEELSDSTKMQYIDINTWLIGDILAKADKMTMAHSLELRVPFLDMNVASLARTLPDKLKWRGKTTKFALREAFKKILPETTRKRKKLGFPTPVRKWLDKERIEVYQAILANPYIKSKLDTVEIKRLIDEHTKGEKDNSRKIYLLLMLALWYNTFIEEPLG